MLGWESRAADWTSRSNRASAIGSEPGLRLDQLERAGPLEQLVLGQVDLAHAARAQSAPELVLAELAGLVELAAQAVQDVGAVNRQGRPDHQEQGV